MKTSYHGLKENTDVVNKMSKSNVNNYVKAFLMKSMEDGKIHVSKQYENKEKADFYVKRNKKAVRRNKITTDETGASQRSSSSIGSVKIMSKNEFKKSIE